MTKQEMYEKMTDTLAPYHERDERLLRDNPEKWQLVREIDDWLVKYRNDDRVGLEQYERNLKRLCLIYHIGDE